MKAFESYIRKGLPIELFFDTNIYTSTIKDKISHEGVIGFFYFLGKKLKFEVATKPQFPYKYNKKKTLIPDIVWHDGKRMHFFEIELTSQKGITKKIGNFIKYLNDQRDNFRNRKIPYPNLILFTKIYNFEDGEMIQYLDARFPNPKKNFIIEHININPDSSTTYSRVKITTKKTYNIIKSSKFLIKSKRVSKFMKKGLLY